MTKRSSSTSSTDGLPTRSAETGASVAGRGAAAQGGGASAVSTQSSASAQGGGASAASSIAASPTEGLFAFMNRGETVRAVDDAAWLQAMLDFEAALAAAEAQAGLIPEAAAAEIRAACRAERFDAAAIGRDAASTGNPAAPLVSALTQAVGGAAGGFVHLGATSQDVMDTATMLVAQRALEPLLLDLSSAADAAAGLARTNRSSPMVARTLLQQALPTTFGAIAAGWLSGLDRASARLEEVASGLAVQFGGGAGTLASLGDEGPAVLRHLAAELDLAEPVVPWHTERTRIAELAGALGEAAGAAAKVALDVVLLAQTEVGEVREAAPGRGGSSTLPQKRNPVAAIAVRAAALRTPGLVATLLASMPQELQRAAGPWQAEWQTLSELFRATGSSAAWLRDCLEHLEVDAQRMRENLDVGRGLALAERVTTALAPSLGRLEAHRLVERAATETVRTGRSFAETLATNPEVADRIGREEIAGLLDATGYLGSAELFVDRALAQHERRARESGSAGVGE